MCVGVSLCVGGLVGGLVWGAGGGLTAEQNMTVVLSVPVVWFGPGSLPHVGKTTISQHDASTFLQNRPTEKAYSAIFLVVTSIIKTIFCFFFYSIRVFEERYHSAQDIFLKISFQLLL